MRRGSKFLNAFRISPVLCRTYTTIRQISHIPQIKLPKLTLKSIQPTPLQARCLELQKAYPSHVFLFQVGHFVIYANGSTNCMISEITDTWMK
jgi:hypothetical protein